MENLVVSELSLIYKNIDGLHYFIGDDSWTKGVVVLDEDYDIAKHQAELVLREHLREHHNICIGEWEIA
jgi:hypothetical protein